MSIYSVIGLSSIDSVMFTFGQTRTFEAIAQKDKSALLTLQLNFLHKVLPKTLCLIGLLAFKSMNVDASFVYVHIHETSWVQIMNTYYIVKVFFFSKYIWN